jgi:hypothetical protein
MKEELSVSLNLDTSKYKTSLESALKSFDGFQKTLSNKKLGFSERQITDLTKVFSKVRTSAIAEFNRIQKRIDTIGKEKVKLDIDNKALTDKLELLKYDLSITWNAQDAQKVREQIKQLEKQIETNEMKLNINSESLENAKNEMTTLVDDMSKNPLEFDFESGKLVQFNNQIDNIVNGFDSAGNKVDEFDEKVNRVARQSRRLNLMGRMFSQIKNTIAASINPLNHFRNQWNKIIMQDDSKFGNTFKLISENITQTLIPVFEKVAQWIINLIGYVNVFLKSISGGKIDLFAKSNKTLKALNKGVKKVKNEMRTVASFDEITDIGDTGSCSNSLGIKPLTKDSFIDPKLDKDITDWIENNSEKIKNMGILFAGIFAVSKVTKALGNLGKLVTGKNGLNFLGTKLGSLGLIAGGIMITALCAKQVWDDIQRMKEEMKTVREATAKRYDEWSKKEEDINKLITTNNVNRTNGYKIMSDTWAKIFGFSNEHKEVLRQTVENSGKVLEKEMEIFNKKKLTYEEQVKLRDSLKSQIKYNDQVIEKLEKAGYNTTELRAINDKYKDSLKSVNDEISKLDKVKLKDKIQKILVKGDTSEFVSKAMKVVEAMMPLGLSPALKASIASTLAALKAIPKYDVGANYIPNDQLAMVHKGEAIIPAKFNDKKYFNNSNNEETNELLKQVISAVENIEINPYTTINDVGKTAVDYIKDKNRTLGRSVI